MDISVVVTIYNQPLTSIKATLKSVILQKGCDFEILIADDCSDKDFSEKLIAFFKSFSFENYQIIRHKENLQTVRNIVNAISYAKGEFIKTIGSGDLLYDEETLRRIIEFMRQNGAVAGFGQVYSYLFNKHEIECHYFKAPRKPEQYYVGGMDRKQVLKHQLDFADWIPGGAQFFKTEYAKLWLGVLAEGFEVRYCEDFAQTLALVENEVAYLDFPVLWYEFGVGVSTSGTGNEQMYSDHEKLYRGMDAWKPFGDGYHKALSWFAARRFIALKTPFYRFFQKHAAKTYQKEETQILPNDFFKRVLAMYLGSDRDNA